MYWLFAFILAPFLTTNFIIALYILLNFYFGLDHCIESIFIRLQKKLNEKIYNLEKSTFWRFYKFIAIRKLNIITKSIEHFIDETILSFANHARAKSYLVFKHHPMDRGYKNYSKLINDLSQKYHVEGRVLYVHDTHLPVLLRKALGCITIIQQ